MTYTAAQLQQKVTLGRESIFRVALVKPDGTTDTSANHKELSLASETTVGFENKTISFSNFASGGDDVEIPVGETGVLELSEMQWIKDDPALVIMETAARNKTPVSYEFLPEGVGAGKAIYKGSMTVNSWVIKSASSATVTVQNPKIASNGMPDKGDQPA
ncbi:hypothetical protein DAETH_48150 (plasmid) [Deinococcus aetherius]|uniref:Phage tail protein n=1 Tax=Deinococcus aetherius TaxID=200252 RepID=A0ABM8ALZ4_9DEIO|nr:hypothetical protein [Deinococcus aetherius]BDP44846.1 hypothetical protein DAETH_48150 [Deinococcus aetherius]